jgi:hypothetical protein
MNETRREGWTFVLCDNLEKVFADEAPRAMDLGIPYSVFVGETGSFQVAFLPPTIEDINEQERMITDLTFTLTGSPFATLSTVQLVPCPMVAFDNADAGYLRTTPGLYPDLLVPSPDGVVAPVVAQWRAVWVDLVVPRVQDAGAHTVTVRAVSTMSGETVFEQSVTITVLPEVLPDLAIANNHWFHCDGLATFYGVEVFGEEHWRIIESFVAKAAEADINSLLMPAWTPPLDTEIGGVRLPTQLIDISWAGDRYQFGFEKLVRWLEMCARHGMRYVEVPHFFTQWGAHFTPAIYVQRDGETVREFGWDVEATDPRYRALLEQLVPAMMDVFEQHWDNDRVIYHISDEPTAPRLESYMRAKAVVADLLDGATIIDALSDYEFHASGAVAVPVVATDAIEPFLEKSVENLWAYYCVGQNKDVANRFIGQPSLRNRVLGWQLFAFDIKGFLQWGYNFYNSQLSKRPINPFEDTSVGGVFPAGDSFLVYPGPDGRPLESIRFRVFATAMADHRAMRLAVERTDSETVMRTIDPDGTLTFDRFSYDPDFYRRTREAVNALITG